MRIGAISPRTQEKSRRNVALMRLESDVKDARPLCDIGTLEVYLRLGHDETYGRCELLEYRVRPGNRGGEVHVHDKTDEYFQVLSGSVEFVLGDRIVQVQAGQHLKAPRGIPHGFRNSSEKPAVMLALFAPACNREQFFLDLAKYRASDQEIDPQTIERLCNRHDQRTVCETFRPITGD